MKQVLHLLFLLICVQINYAQVQVFDISDSQYNLDYNNAQIAIQAAYNDAKVYAENNNDAPTKIYIPAGDYYLQLGNSTLIAMNQGPSNMTIEGAGMHQTKLIAEGFDSKFFSVIKTDNITIKGMTLTRLGTPFFQGTIETKLGANKVIVRRSPGFADPIFLDDNSGSQHTLWKITNSLSNPQSHPDMRVKKKIKDILADPNDPNLFTFSGNNWKNIFNQGDRVVMKAKYGEGTIKTSKADNITIENITIINTGASAIRITSGEKEFTVRNVHIKRGEAVNNLGEVAYYTCGGGGFSFTHGNGNSIMENCTIEGTGDDPFSIHTYDSGDTSNPPHLIVRNNTFKDVHGDLYFAELKNAEIYDNTIIRTNLQITNRSNQPSHDIVLRNNEFIENVRQGTIRISGLPNYLNDITQWHHDIDIYDNTFTNTGSATSILKLQIAKNITFRDNVINGFTAVNLYSATSQDPAIIDFDNQANYTPPLINSLQGTGNCIINSTPALLATHQTPLLTNINNSPICIDFCNSINDNAICATSLPVDLTHFTVSKNANTHELQWATAYELNNIGFEIEHRTNNSNWSNIGFIASSSLMNYSFIFYTPQTGNNYYRLKQVDFDGSESYSPVVYIYQEEELDFTISPIPSNGNITIVLSNAWTTAIIEGSLVNAHGQQVWSNTFPYSSNTIPLSFDYLNPGIYFLTLKKGNQQVIKKLIII